MRVACLKNKFCNRIILIITCVISIGVMLTACAVANSEQDKLNDIDFTVVGEDEQPDSLKEIIAEKAKSSFQITYVIDGDMYIAVGYGQQQGGGYSISVNEFYETQDNIYIDTTLIGPGKDEAATDIITTPYIVIKTQNREDKTVEFK